MNASGSVAGQSAHQETSSGKGGAITLAVEEVTPKVFASQISLRTNFSWSPLRARVLSGGKVRLKDSSGVV